MNIGGSGRNRHVDHKLLADDILSFPFPESEFSSHSGGLGSCQVRRWESLGEIGLPVGRVEVVEAN